MADRDAVVTKYGVRFYLKDEHEPFMTVHPRFDNPGDARTFAQHILKDESLSNSIEQANIFQETPCVLRARWKPEGEDT